MSTLPLDHETRVQRALVSLQGLSVGDAFGERFFVPTRVVETWIAQGAVDAPAPWPWTDDTAMAICLVETLETHGDVHLDDFAARLARRYAAEPWRGYGPGAHALFEQVSGGVPWREAAAGLFGTGSFGNGSAMRVAPLGAFYATDLASCAERASRSATVTHAHPEGRAGAVAVAIAAATWATVTGAEARRAALWENVLAHTPPGQVRDRIVEASRIPPRAPVAMAAATLGNGSRVTAMDTVPFCLWAVSAHPGDLREALWTTVAGLGDRDTTCAIVAGILGCAEDVVIPSEFLAKVEPLPGAAGAVP